MGFYLQNASSSKANLKQTIVFTKKIYAYAYILEPQSLILLVGKNVIYIDIQLVLQLKFRYLFRSLKKDKGATWERLWESLTELYRRKRWKSGLMVRFFFFLRNFFSFSWVVYAGGRKNRLEGLFWLRFFFFICICSGWYENPGIFKGRALKGFFFLFIVFTLFYYEQRL